jgi:L-arabinose isomerase
MRAGKPFAFMTGHAEDKVILSALAEYAVAARVIKRLKRARIGLIGHTYQGMTDLMVDQYALRHIMGPLVWQVEIEELGAATAAVPDSEAKALADKLGALFDASGVSREFFLRSVKLIAAYQRLIQQHRLDAVCSFDQALLSDPRIGIAPPLATSWLTSQGIPFTCELDVPTAVAMLIMQEIAGSATFLEYLVIDFDSNAILLSHDGHGNPALATAPKDVKILESIYYKGVHGYGAAGNYAYKAGDVTQLALVSVGCRGWRLVAGEGESISWDPRPIVAPQMLFRPQEGRVEKFIDRWCIAGAGHHQAVGYGRVSSVVAKVAELLGIEAAIV